MKTETMDNIMKLIGFRIVIVLFLRIIGVF